MFVILYSFILLYLMKLASRCFRKKNNVVFVLKLVVDYIIKFALIFHAHNFKLLNYVFFNKNYRKIA